MQRYFVQVNDANKVFALSQLSSRIIEVAANDERLLGTSYIDGTFVGYKIALTADKTQITANGIGAATITATTTNWDGTPAISYASVTFKVNSVEYPTNCTNGVATFAVTADVTGNYVVSVTDDIMSKNEVTVSAV